MTSVLEIRKYTPDMRELWDTMVKNSANGTFMFMRDYMEYHAHRFEDFSLVIFNRNKPVALLPASKHNDNIISHGGLTYGGFITIAEVSSSMLIDIFDSTLQYLRQAHIKGFTYKLVPHIYHSYPHEAEQYALYKAGATRIACNLSSAIDLATPLQYAELRRRGIKRAMKQGVVIEPSDDYTAFWKVLSDNLLQRHHVQPVHTLDEISLLHSQFPHNIQLYEARLNGQVVAGCVMYITNRVAHAQYISATTEGKECGALDLLFATLIEKEFNNHRYFDFGISTESGGEYLNTGLLTQKEGFGARGIVYETYHIAL